MNSRKLIWGSFLILIGLLLVVHNFNILPLSINWGRMASLWPLILIILGLSILSNKLGIAHGASIALFPMVILTMTIERMCVLWEERGAYDALISGFGSIFAAVIAFLVMKNKELDFK